MCVCCMRCFHGPNSYANMAMETENVFGQVEKEAVFLWWDMGERLALVRVGVMYYRPFQVG